MFSSARFSPFRSKQGLVDIRCKPLLQGPPLLDAVLIACPLEQSQLKLSLPKAPVIPPRKYQVTNTFYVRAGSPILTFNPSPPGEFLLA